MLHLAFQAVQAYPVFAAGIYTTSVLCVSGHHYAALYRQWTETRVAIIKHETDPLKTTKNIWNFPDTQEDYNRISKDIFVPATDSLIVNVTATQQHVIADVDDSATTIGNPSSHGIYADKMHVFLDNIEHYVSFPLLPAIKYSKNQLRDFLSWPIWAQSYRLFAVFQYALGKVAFDTLSRGFNFVKRSSKSAFDKLTKIDIFTLLDQIAFDDLPPTIDLFKLSIKNSFNELSEFLRDEWDSSTTVFVHAWSRFWSFAIDHVPSELPEAPDDNYDWLLRGILFSVSAILLHCCLAPMARYKHLKLLALVSQTPAIWALFSWPLLPQGWLRDLGIYAITFSVSKFIIKEKLLNILINRSMQLTGKIRDCAALAFYSFCQFFWIWFLRIWLRIFIFRGIIPAIIRPLFPSIANEWPNTLSFPVFRLISILVYIHYRFFICAWSRGELLRLDTWNYHLENAMHDEITRSMSSSTHERTAIIAAIIAAFGYSLILRRSNRFNLSRAKVRASLLMGCYILSVVPTLLQVFGVGIHFGSLAFFPSGSLARIRYGYLFMAVFTDMMSGYIFGSTFFGRFQASHRDEDVGNLYT